jgi:hypothetical protein
MQNYLRNLHDTVCHKYMFITEEGINTQAVESFNNIIKIRRLEKVC